MSEFYGKYVSIIKFSFIDQCDHKKLLLYHPNPEFALILFIRGQSAYPKVFLDLSRFNHIPP